jgi:hypothetical protein
MEEHSVSANSYEYYLEDTLLLLFNRAKPKPLEADQNRMFEAGRNLGYYEALSTMLNQAEAFGLPIEKFVKFDIDELLR